MKKYMNKFLSLSLVVVMFLSFSLSAFGIETQDYLAGLEQGRREAEVNYQWEAWGWGVAGAAGGYMKGLVGGGVFAFTSTLFEPWVGKQRMASIEDESLEFQEGYVKGFKETAQKKNAKFAAIGAGLGILIQFFVKD
ncbi:MAG TPA: hypothetical protein GXZ36_05260 [Firmicutes bacterium]|mgnify:CR=1 FL=1|nr:hypothetical protein [Bacillota bacterium]